MDGSLPLMLKYVAWDIVVISHMKNVMPEVLNCTKL